MNKRTVDTYMEGFRRSDHGMILDCLTEDVEWIIPGMFHIRGKEAFDKEIENDQFIGSPIITIARMSEENDVVIAEGSVRAQRKDGAHFELAICDVFDMKDGRISRLVSYLMPTSGTPVPGS
ncbi:MAG TPA: nuclear transport factor 2 family protein [Thermoanaerobaculia bacterium]|nr:nuclear transport factor 2 family protein [Thermoanaerobaculia bacterium]